jgi:hypothetical protein
MGPDKVGEPLGVGMIADDRYEVARQLALILPVQQIGKAVVICGNQDGNPGTVASQCQVVLDMEPLGQGLKVVFKIGDRHIELR